MSGWQDFLYPLGFIAQSVFFCRVFVQWIQSEIKHESVVSRSFWNLSLVGSVLMMVHAMLQMQFHVSLVQACNGVIAWRNLNFMQPAQLRVTFKTVIKLLLLAVSFVTLLFFLEWYYIFQGNESWLRTPTFFQNNPSAPSWFWHAIGSIGIILFAGRFWVQWWDAERMQRSELGKRFWWLSLIGALLSCSYFLRINDFVNFLGPGMGMVAYIRNLIFLRKHPAVTSHNT